MPFPSRRCRKEPLTPPVFTFLTTFSLDPIALVALVVAAALYAAGVLSLRRKNHYWPRLNVLAFYLLGLGSFAWIEFGFLGTWSHDLRWAFTTRIALLLFMVPGLLALGKPIALARVALRGRANRRLVWVLHSWPARFFGNAIFAPLFALAGFLVFLTPFAATLRLSPIAAGAITLVVPLVGLLMVAPIFDNAGTRSSFFITAEFLIAFVELVMDAIPGILLRLNNHVLDHAPAIVGNLPAWFPDPLHDQHLSGDFLWFIAEVADVPVLIVLFLRWNRSDRREAKSLDALTDEQMEELTRAHLGLRERN